MSTSLRPRSRQRKRYQDTLKADLEETDAGIRSGEELAVDSSGTAASTKWQPVSRRSVSLSKQRKEKFTASSGQPWSRSLADLALVAGSRPESQYGWHLTWLLSTVWAGVLSCSGGAREERLRREEEELKKRKLQGAINQAKLMEDFKKQKEKEVLRLQEEAQTFITPENLDERIEQCLDDPQNYNFAIDKKQRIIRHTTLS
ncbi:28S ribosomal protein S26, mitochondrial [Alligator sinensis]|uniref:Small ribosomal subunit protein mS26 n=1 Tax=Alligator sinensis TaxID=38654 RepID=A0A3Q0G9X2_ALLSI|nr:28S ribosomal protein S26, mitochondrial [Alligator sinensis]